MEKIAIVGMSCLFPGANTLDSFWNNLIEGSKSISPPRPQHTNGIDPSYFFDPTRSVPDKSYFLEGGRITEFQFDATGFLLPEAFLQAFDDTVKWTLYVAREALRDSGYSVGETRLEKCGLLLGALGLPTKGSYAWLRRLYTESIESGLRDAFGSTHNFLKDLPMGAAPISENGLLAGFPVSLASRALGLGGVHFSMDAACASGLYAISLACKYLHSGKVDVMLAGAVSAADPLFVNMGFATFEAYPMTGRNQPLDSTSEGLISSEGAGMLVLKRFSDALRDNNQIYAVIDGIGLANDGRGKHVLTPNSKGQVLAFERAYHVADTHPDEVEYVECHASGTPLGDKTELNSMETFFEPHTTQPLIGSVKANIGHLLTAAGVGSVIKTVLSMKHGMIPATPGVVTPLSSQNNLFGGSSIAQHNRNWPNSGADSQPKRAGINAFGFGGVSAHMVMTSHQLPTSIEQSAQNMEIKMTPMAIVGMDAHFGKAEDLNSFERTIYDGIQHFIPVPEKRWKGIDQTLSLESGGNPDLGLVTGAFIDQFDIDFLRYKLPPNNEEQPIAQQLLLLKVADNAIKDANLVTGSNVAVIVATGSELSLHQARARIDLGWQISEGSLKQETSLKAETLSAIEAIVKDSLHKTAEVNHYTSHIGNIISSRVSALWDFSGPAFTVSAEENSVFRALEIAQILLSNQEVDAVVLGAVDLAGGIESVIAHAELGKVNTGTHTLSFDQSSSGWQIGEGAGAVVLTRAEPDLHIEAYAVIESLAIVQDLRPTAEAVKQAVQSALDVGHVEPHDIGYLEVCASGFEAFDAAEQEGLIASYSGDNGLTCALGSVKANVGHTFAASGIASLIKTALCIHKRIIPAVPNWSDFKNPEQWSDSPFYVMTKSKTWFLGQGEKRRYAAINSIGIDNGHVHLVLGEAIYPRTRHHGYLQSSTPKLILITAAYENEIYTQLDTLEAQIDVLPLEALAQASFEHYVKSFSGNYVLSLLVRDSEGLRREIRFARKGIHESIQTGQDWSTPQGSCFSPNPLGNKGKVAFVYPGAFNAYPRLGQDLFELFPQSYEHLLGVHSNLRTAFADDLINPRSQNRITRKDWGRVRDRLESDSVAMMEAGISFSVLYTHILRNYFNIKADSALGYSLGEGSMFWALGVWKDGDLASQEMHASPLFAQRLSGPMETLREVWGIQEGRDIWAAYFISAPAEVVARALEKESHVYLTHINTPNEVMIAGRPDACERIVASLGFAHMRAPFSVIIHCEIVQPEYQSFYRMHHFPIHQHPEITFYSAADYEPSLLTQDVLAHNMARIVCKPVDFPRLVGRSYDDGARIFIELGPRSTCARWVSEILGDKEHVAVSINTLGVDDLTGILRLVARCASHQVPIDLSVLYVPEKPVTAPHRTLFQTITLGGESIRQSIADRTRELLASTLAPDANAGKAATFSKSLLPQKSVDIADRGTRQAEGSVGAIEVLRERRASMRNLGDSLLKDLAAIREGVYEGLGEVEHDTISNPVTLPKIEKPALYPLRMIEEFATGSISACFGERYHIYDSVRAPRVPNSDLLLISRVLEIRGERYKSEPGTEIITEYDIPVDAWFYRDNSYPEMPYSVMMEIALQPCGFLSAYHGPTLDFPGIDFYFRNLDGQGKLLHSVDLRGKTITNRVKMVNSTTMQGIIIQKFEFNLMYEGVSFYVGDATFGYFTASSLASQAGLDRGKATQPWHTTLSEAHAFRLYGSKSSVMAMRDTDPTYPHRRLPVRQLDFLDEFIGIANSGKQGLGYIYGVREVAPSDWYFKCHFFQDPVMPGSLGVEAILQAMQAFALRAGITNRFHNPHFVQLAGHNTVWRYRGQVLSSSPRVYFEIHITDIHEEGGRTVIIGDASLWRHDFLRIYEIKGAAISISETKKGLP